MAAVQQPRGKVKIGQGSFGTVYRYKHEGEEYAVKKIYKDTKNHPELIEKIEAEGRIMQRVSNHRNIVGFLGEMTKGKYLYLLTEFVPNGDLRKVRTLASEDDAWEIIMQMALALQHLRKNNIIHRDIKPENILIKQSKNQNQQLQTVLKLADFGLAEIVQDGQRIQGIAGSPIYLAPQMCSHDLYGPEVDIWSLGITLYQLVHQQQSPYQQDILNYINSHQNYTQKQLFNYLIKRIQQKRIKCSSPFNEINILIQSMLNHDPEKRPTPFQLLRHEKVMERIIKFNQSRRSCVKIGREMTASTKGQLTENSNKENSFQQSNGKKNGKSGINKGMNIELAFSPSRNEQSLLFLSSRLSRSLISELNQTQPQAQVQQSLQLISLEQSQLQ